MFFGLRYRILLKDLIVDLRFMPRYFWWGLGLEAVGSAGCFLSVPHTPLVLAFFVVFVVGAVLCLIGHSAALPEQDAAASENSDRTESGKKPARAPVLGGFLVVVGLAGLTMAAFFRDTFGILPMGATAVASIVIGVCYCIHCPRF